MKKILCYFIVFAVAASLISPIRSYADSPITSTPFYTAYLDIDPVIKASEMCCVDEETSKYLSNPENPIEVKAAIINAIGWEVKRAADIDQTNADYSLEDNTEIDYNIYGKNNAERYSHFIFEKSIDDLNLDMIPAHDLFCIGYFLALDHYFEPERAVILLEKASAAIPESFTVAMVTAIAKAQLPVVSGNIDAWNKVWNLVNDVIQNKNLEQDMRAEAVERITEYMILYKDYNDKEIFDTLEQQTATPNLITSKPITLTYFKEMPDYTDGSEKNFSDEAFYKKLEERTNITLSFIPVGKEVMVGKLMVMTAAGDMPDLIEFPWQRHEDLIERMADSSAIIELDDLIKKAAPHLHGILQSNPEIITQITSNNGHIYQIPGIDLRDSRVTTGPVIRADLLNKYGLEAPETIDDWEKMLIAIRDGGDRIIPLSFDMSILKDSESFIGAFGIPYGFGVRNSIVFYGPVEESYKGFLTTFSRWYRKGLIDPEFILLRNTQLKDRVNSGNVGTFIGRADDLKDSLNVLKSMDASFELIPVQNPFFKNFDRLIARSGVPTITEFGIAISSSNKYPEESMKWIDYAYGEEGHRLFQFGVEEPADAANDEQAIHLSTQTQHRLPGYLTDERIEKEDIYPEQKEAVRLWSIGRGENPPSLMPPVSLTQEEHDEFSAIMDNLSAYTDEMFAKYVLGAVSLDQFEEYVSTAKKIGVDRAIEIMQAALDRDTDRWSVLKVNGKIIETDTDPVIISEGEILVPIRFITESLGGCVAWNRKNKMVTGIWRDTVFSFQLNSTEAMVNYEPKTMNRQIKAINQRTYVPVDFIQEVFGATVHWDEKNQTVSIAGT